MLKIQSLINDFIQKLNSKEQSSILKWDTENKLDILNKIEYRKKDRANIQMMFVNWINQNQLIATMIFSNGIYFHHLEKEDLSGNLSIIGAGAAGGAVLVFLGLSNPIGWAALAAVGLYSFF